MMNDLFAFFPQWQGSGATNELFTAAVELKNHLPTVPFRVIAVDPETLSGVEHGILGYQSILKQQLAERECVEDTLPDRIFSLGGDCSIEIVPVSYLNRRYDGKLAVLWLDAHGDLNSPETSPSGHFHGMPLRFLLDEAGTFAETFCCSRLDPAQVVMAGIRALDAPEDRFLRESRIPVFTVAEIEADPGMIARYVLQHGMRNVYLHLDLDVLEPAEFPYLKCPEPGGLGIGTLLAVIERLKAECRVVGFSVLEYTRIQGDQGLADIQRIIQSGIGDWLA